MKAIATVISFLSLLIVLFTFSQDNMWISRAKYVSIPLGFFSFLILVQSRIINIQFLGALSAISIAMLFFGSISGGKDPSFMSSPYTYLFILCNFLIAKMIVDKNLEYYFSFLAFILAVAISLDFIYNPSPIVKYSSYNAYGSLLVFSCAMFTISSKNKKNIASIYPAVITLIISVLLYGRSNIITTAILLGFILIGDMRFKTLFLMFFVFIFLYQVYNIDIYQDLILAETNFAQGLDTPRTDMIRHYLSGIDAFSLFFGLPVDNIPFIYERWGTNPHNAFIRLFSVFGIFPFLLFFVVPMLCDWSKLTLVGLGCFLVVILRSMTDSIVVHTPLDLFFFIILLLLFKGPTGFKSCDRNFVK